MARKTRVAIPNAQGHTTYVVRDLLSAGEPWEPRIGDVVQARVSIVSPTEDISLVEGSVGIVKSLHPKARAACVVFVVMVSPGNHELILGTGDLKFMCHAEETPDADRH